MSLFQVRVNWTGPSSPLLSTHYFDGANVGGPAQAADAAGDWWSSVQAVVGTGFSWSVDPEVRTIDEVSGGLLAIATVVGQSGAGSLAGEPLDLLQGVASWHTGLVVDGRVLKGRTFIPGPTEGANDSDATPTAGYASAVNSATTTLLARVDADLAVWHRPVFDPETGARTRDGSFELVTSGSVENQWSYLRSRRR